MHFVSVSEADETTWLELNVQQGRMRWARNGPLLQKSNPGASQTKHRHSISRIGIGPGRLH